MEVPFLDNPAHAKKDLKAKKPRPWYDPFVGGAVAGLTVDVALFPIDTVKTRMQAKGGLWANGGLKGLYSGIGVTALGSMPGAAVFFGCYDQGKKATGAFLPPVPAQVAAAGFGECVACLVRVPTEMVKQQLQSGQFRRTRRAVEAALAKGGVRGLYRGYGVTLAREIPFSAIQFPLYEALKRAFAGNPVLCGLAGMMSGGVAAALTTPLDVAKTRIMLGQATTNGVAGAVAEVARTEGVRALFRGVGPRTFWISLGGFFFFMSYEATVSLLGNRRRWYEEDMQTQMPRD